MLVYYVEILKHALLKMCCVLMSVGEGEACAERTALVVIPKGLFVLVSLRQAMSLAWNFLYIN